MATNAVPGFLPSRHGLRFPNRWPRAAARRWSFGLLELGIGDTSRGLCGGMAFVARDRFERGELGPTELTAPEPGTALFREIVARQLASFGRLWAEVPVRFWVAAAFAGQRRRDRDSVGEAWPAIRADIDAGRPSMVGLVRRAAINPLADLGHQVLGFRYDVSPNRIAIGVYDPNHPGDDTVEVRMLRAPEGGLSFEQSTGEPVIGLLHLPFRPPSPA